MFFTECHKPISVFQQVAISRGWNMTEIFMKNNFWGESWVRKALIQFRFIPTPLLRCTYNIGGKHLFLFLEFYIFNQFQKFSPETIWIERCGVAT